jgi:excisionase family DNA binding protein
MTDRALSLKEAAALLGLSYSTVYAHKLEMGFFQVGNQWRVWPDRLKSATEYNSDRPAQTEPRSKKCQSESAKVVSGISISANQAVDALDKRLARPTERRLRSITTR